MISFKKKPAPQPSAEKPEENRFEQIRKTAAKKHEKSASAARRNPSPADEPDDKLL